MSEWNPLSDAISQKKFDDLYIAELAKEAGLPRNAYRRLLLYLASKCDRRRYKKQPNDLGRRSGRPRKEVPVAVEALHAALLTEGVKPSRADRIAAQGDKKLAEVLRKRRAKKPKP
jgi:hypothetical protein